MNAQLCGRPSLQSICSDPRSHRRQTHSKSLGRYEADASSRFRMLQLDVGIPVACPKLSTYQPASSAEVGLCIVESQGDYDKTLFAQHLLAPSAGKRGLADLRLEIRGWEPMEARCEGFSCKCFSIGASINELVALGCCASHVTEFLE